MLTALVEELRDRGRAELAAALAGRTLRVTITFTDADPRTTSNVAFTAAGNVLVLSSENLAGRDFEPHVELRGTADVLLAFLLGDVSVVDAVERAVVVPHLDLARFREVQVVVTAALRRVLQMTQG